VNAVKPDLMALLKQNKAPTVTPSATRREDPETAPVMSEQANGGKTALLSLFGTDSGKQPTPEAIVAPVGEQQKLSNTVTDAQNSLLGVFGKPALPVSTTPSNIKPASPTGARPDAFDRRPSSKSDHQASLLSLFGQARPSSSVEVGSSAVISPISATQMALPPRRTTPGSGTVADFKRASSAGAQGQDVAMRSRMNSTTSRDGIGSGSQTPISSTDRGFLLNYLKGL